MDKVNLREKLGQFSEHWSPKIVGSLNGQHVRLAKLQGEFVWHSHVSEDELFLVLDGTLEMQFRDRTVVVEKDEFIIVPRGIEHCPRADEEVHILLFEPAETLNTGDADDHRMVHDLETL